MAKCRKGITCHDVPCHDMKLHDLTCRFLESPVPSATLVSSEASEVQGGQSHRLGWSREYDCLRTTSLGALRAGLTGGATLTAG